jgi:hypothetical protein
MLVAAVEQLLMELFLLADSEAVVLEVKMQLQELPLQLTQVVAAAEEAAENRPQQAAMVVLE